jgi:hypothetical protein
MSNVLHEVFRLYHCEKHFVQVSKASTTLEEWSYERNGMRMTTQEQGQMVVFYFELPISLFLNCLLVFVERSFVCLLHRGWDLKQFFDFIF